MKWQIWVFLMHTMGVSFSSQLRSFSANLLWQHTFPILFRTQNYLSQFNKTEAWTWADRQASVSDIAFNPSCHCKFRTLPKAK